MTHSSPLGIAWKCVLPHRGTLAAAISWRVLSILAPLQIPVLTAVILDALAGEKPKVYGMPLSFEDASQALAAIAAALLFLAAVYASTRYARVATEARLSRGIVSDLKTRLFEHVTTLSRDQHQRFGSGDLLNRIIHDTGAVRSFITRVFVHAPTNVLQVAYPVVMLFFIDAFLASIALAALLPQSIGTHVLQGRLHRATRLRRQSKSDLTVAVKESLDEIESIQSLSAEKHTCLQFEATAERLEKDELHMSRLDGLIQATVWLTSGAALAVAWWIGGLRVIEGTITIGTLVMFTGFVALVYQPFRFLTEMQKTYRTGIVAFERIQELLNSEPFVPAANGGYPIKIVDARIEFRDVSFTYDGEPVLHGIDFEIPAGKITAIVGASGSGKSTLLRLIPLLDRPATGSILIDGQPLDHVSVESLRAKVAFIPQRGSIFSGTVRENLSLARPSASQDLLVSACRKAHAMEFIERLDDGFDTVLGKGGTTLSAGQEKRLAIARALLGQPRVLVLDVPEAALDRSSLFFLLDALKELTPGVTVVLATAHPEFARAADKIVIIDDGRIAQSGDYDSLAKTSPRFRQLFGTFDTPFETLETSIPDSIIAPRFQTKTPESRGNTLAS